MLTIWLYGLPVALFAVTIRVGLNDDSRSKMLDADQPGVMIGTWIAIFGSAVIWPLTLVIIVALNIVGIILQGRLSDTPERETIT